MVVNIGRYDFKACHTDTVSQLIICAGPLTTDSTTPPPLTSVPPPVQMAKIDEKIDGLKAELKAAKKAGNDTKVASLTKRIEKAELDKRQKDALKNVSLGTSKINYNDPRITVAWCKRHDVPIQKPFAKTLMAKFTWAMSVEPSFRF